MYYGSNNNPYANVHLNHYIKNNLPMDEFGNGNFSQAHKIIETYGKYIKECIASNTFTYTGGEGNINTYLQKKLARLQEEHKEQTERKNQAIKEIEDLQKQIDKEKQAIKNEGEGDKIWNIFFDFREKNDLNLEMLEKAFENTKYDKPEKYEETKGIFERFFASANKVYHERLKDLEEKNMKQKRGKRIQISKICKNR